MHDQYFLQNGTHYNCWTDVTLKTRLRKKHVEQMETYCSERCKPAVQYMKSFRVLYERIKSTELYTG